MKKLIDILPGEPAEAATVFEYVDELEREVDKWKSDCHDLAVWNDKLRNDIRSLRADILRLRNEIDEYTNILERLA